MAARELYSTDFHQYGHTIALFWSLLYLVVYVIGVAAAAVIFLLSFVFGCVLAGE